MSTWDDKPNDHAHAVAQIEHLKRLSKDRNAIIEECARVADMLSIENRTFEIAAAIRALKDKR